MKKLLASLILLPNLALACDMARALSETHFVIDPASGKSKIESKNNFSQFEVSRCAPESKFLMVNFNSIYFQDDTSRLESISGELIQKSSNCSIKTELPYQKIENSVLESIVRSRHQFLRSCVRLVIADTRGVKITQHANSKCTLKSLNENGSTVEAEGSGCLIAVNPNSRLVFEPRLNNDCLQSSYLSQNQIQAGDVESAIKLWPVAQEAGQLKVMSPVGARYLRHTVLPAAGFMPRAVKEDQQQMPYMSSLATNISPGAISMNSMGRNLVSIQPTFLVENFSKEFCKDGMCARPSAFVAPISSSVTLTQINLPNGRKSQVGEWTHSLKVPANWSGLAEFKVENNLTGISMGALNANLSIKPGDEFVLEAKFYEPRTHLDEVSYNQDFFSLNGLGLEGEDSNSALPTLPKIGELTKVGKLPALPPIALGREGVLDFSDRLNMPKNWTHKYDRVCNSQNLNCVRLSGMDKPFVTVKMQFKIGPNKEVQAIKVAKLSEVFGSYEQGVQAFAKKVCE
ncbi:hypothetical protein K2P97_11775 [bacterium]|nr:hypothetical protein [bacterium]